jgi:hypothetical protein
MFPWEMDIDGESSKTLGQMEDLVLCAFKAFTCA